jgi:hypothetical protein
MRKNVIIAALLLLLIGLAVIGHRDAPPTTVHAQLSSPAYVCNEGPAGANNGYPCAQYIVAVAPQRLGGGIFIYQIQDQQVDVRTLNAPLVTSGSVNDGASIQVLQPGSDTKTVTITVGNP